MFQNLNLNSLNLLKHFCIGSDPGSNHASRKGTQEAHLDLRLLQSLDLMEQIFVGDNT